MPLRCPRTRPVWNSNVVLLHDRPFAASQKLPGSLSKGVSKRNTSTGSEFFSISQCRGLDATKLVLLSHQFLYRDNLPLKLGNITDRNIISRASLRNVFHWLSSLFKGYKSALLNSKRDTGTEKTKTNIKKTKKDKVDVKGWLTVPLFKLSVNWNVQFNNITRRFAIIKSFFVHN